jgi:hypothetical protein
MPVSKGIRMGPVTASDGIQEIDVTLFSYLMTTA